MSIHPRDADNRTELDPEVVRREIRRFLDEDVGSGDVTTARVVPAGATASGWIVSREECVVAGIPLARAVFNELDDSLDFRALAADGQAVEDRGRLVELRGRAAPILTGERLALNLLQRLSGVATLTRRYVDAVAGLPVRILDTRKTTPGLRLFEKYAVRAGGGYNHRVGLYDAVLIKDNHIAVAGDVAAALQRARTGGRLKKPVQIEVDSIEQLTKVLNLGVDSILLDNMTPETVALAVQTVRRHPRGGNGCWIEASGGIQLGNVRSYAETGVNAISVGALTHSARAVDLALDLELPRDPE